MQTPVVKLCSDPLTFLNLDASSTDGTKWYPGFSVVKCPWDKIGQKALGVKAMLKETPRLSPQYSVTTIALGLVCLLSF